MAKPTQWPINETYQLSRTELEGLLEEMAWRLWEDFACQPPQGITMPGACITPAVKEALDSLFLRAQ